MKKLVSENVGYIRFSKCKSLYLYLILVPVLFIDFSKISNTIIYINIALTILTVCIGHSVGLHRGIIHKTYDTTLFFRNILLCFFVLTGLGSPKDWLKMHYYRDVWQNRKDCPKYFQYKHHILLDFYWNLHLSFYPKNEAFYNIPKSDLNDKFINYLHKTWFFYLLFWFMFVLFFTNLNTALFLFNFRIAVTILGHWFIGYVSHKYGYAHYEIDHADESAYNNLILGYISFGEGFHNNHHAFPKSAKLGIEWYEFDLGWVFVLLFQKLHLIKNVQIHILKNSAHKTAVKWNLP